MIAILLFLILLSLIAIFSTTIIYVNRTVNISQASDSSPLQVIQASDSLPLQVAIDTSSSPLQVTQDPTTTLFDSFGRMRTSGRIIIFESKQVSDNNPTLWYQVSGTGATWTHSNDRAASWVTTTINTASISRRQTYRYLDYSPGTSNLCMMTADLLRSVPADAPGVTIRIGQFDSKNGIFFEYSNNTMNVVVRTYITGVAVDTIVPQSEWDDPMDGTGASGITADWSTVQIYTFDYGWLGAADIRYGLYLNGKFLVFYRYHTSNIIGGVYMSTPQNPLRFEVITTSESPSIISEHICSSLVTEDGSGNGSSGVAFALPSSRTYQVDDNANDYVLMAFKLKDDHNNTIIPSAVDVYNLSNNAGENVVWKLILNPTYSVVALTFTDVTDSSVQYFEGAVTPNPLPVATGGIVIGSGLTSSSGKNATGQGHSGIVAIQESLNLMGRDENGDSQTIAITCRCVDATTNVAMRMSFAWREL